MCERCDIFLKVFRADEVQDHIGPLPICDVEDLLRKFAVRSEDAVLKPEISKSFYLVGRSRCTDNLGPCGLSQVKCCQADAGCGSVNEQGLAFLKTVLCKDGIVAQ